MIPYHNVAFTREFMIQKHAVFIESAEIKTGIHKRNHETLNSQVRFLRIESDGNYLRKL